MNCTNMHAHLNCQNLTKNLGKTVAQVQKNGLGQRLIVKQHRHGNSKFICYIPYCTGYRVIFSRLILCIIVPFYVSEFTSPDVCSVTKESIATVKNVCIIQGCQYSMKGMYKNLYA